MVIVYKLFGNRTHFFTNLMQNKEMISKWSWKEVPILLFLRNGVHVKLGYLAWRCFPFIVS